MANEGVDLAEGWRLSIMPDDAGLFVPALMGPGQGIRLVHARSSRIRSLTRTDQQGHESPPGGSTGGEVPFRAIVVRTTAPDVPGASQHREE